MDIEKESMALRYRYLILRIKTLNDEQKKVVRQLISEVEFKNMSELQTLIDNLKKPKRFSDVSASLL